MSKDPEKVSVEEAKKVEVPEDGGFEPIIPKCIIRRSMLVDDEGHMVEERKVIEGEPPEDHVTYIARASVAGKFKIGQAEHKYEIPLPRATTPREAFEQIHEEGPKHYPQACKELKEKVKRAVDKLAKQAADRMGGLVTMPGGALDEKGQLRGGPGPILGG
jgi:hypothetical protein